MVKNTVFPERQRCITCRKKLNKIVLLGMYCSYPCAKAIAPSGNIVDAPRSCKYEKKMNGKSVGWVFKAKYRCDSEVPEKLRKDPATNIYVCDYCKFLHVGHSRLDTLKVEKMRRIVSDAETLGRVVRLSREAKDLTIKDVAKIIKVPAIRIKEIETGNEKVNLQALFKVLSFLKIKVEFIEQ